jgi:hypothetical protein
MSSALRPSWAASQACAAWTAAGGSVVGCSVSAAGGVAIGVDSWGTGCAAGGAQAAKRRAIVASPVRLRVRRDWNVMMIYLLLA